MTFRTQALTLIGLLGVLQTRPLYAQSAGLVRGAYWFNINRSPNVVDQYLVQVGDQWMWLSSSGLPDPTVTVALVVALETNPTSQYVASTDAVAIGDLAKAQLTQTVNALGYDQCFYAFTSITTTTPPPGGSSRTWPLVNIGDGCVPIARTLCADGSCHGCPEVCASDPDSCSEENNTTCRSPIVVNLDGHGFEFSGPEDPVRFDLDSDGSPELITWTRRGSGDAFLVLDVDGSGRVDDGGELFGNYTLLADGHMAGNGYLALAQYDTLAQGGNRDGTIDKLDAVYPRLKLWVDANHDGIAQACELMTLEEAGVVRIDLTYHRSERRDRYGNRLRYMSDAWIRRGRREVRVSTVDVFFISVR